MQLTKDFLSGLLFMSFGAATVVIGSSYRLGSLAKMGPGYFPLMIGTAITVIGAIITARVILKPDSSEPVADFGLRPLVVILVAILAFGVLVRSAGLVIAIMGLILVSRLARIEGSWLELAIMLLVLTAIPIGIFVYGLGLPFELWSF